MCPKSHICFTVLYSTLVQYTYCVVHYFSNTFLPGIAKNSLRKQHGRHFIAHNPRGHHNINTLLKCAALAKST